MIELNKPLPVIFEILLLSFLTCISFPARTQCGVNPIPVATVTPTIQTICSGSPITNIVLSSNIAGTTFSWTRDNTVSVTGIATTGTGNISGILTNSTNAPVSVNFAITPVGPSQLINESFNTVSPLPVGWAQQNLSSPVGVQPLWFAGNAFPPYSPPGFIAANYENTTVGNQVSNWLFTPVITMKNGDKLSFYTRTSGSVIMPDMLQVRMSANGASTYAGNNSTSVGDFTALLATINSSLIGNGYPSVWTPITVTITGLPSAGITGRIAFRYLTINSVIPGENSTMIGIDDVTFTTLSPCVGLPVISTVVVNPLPTVSVVSNIQPPILPGQVVTLTATVSPTGGTFSWQKDGVIIPGANSNILAGITVTDLGTYTVTYSDLNGCSNTANFNVTGKQGSGLFIHPNPNNGHFRVTFYNKGNEEVTVTLYNSEGRMVLMKRMMTGASLYAKTEIEVNPPGNSSLYMVDVRNSKGQLIGSDLVMIAR